MKIFELKEDLISFLKSQASEKIISFVPTMGALHEGHMSLIESAKQESDLVVCSIFVNPTQFNNTCDLQNYPRSTKKDIELLSHRKCDVLYLPEVKDLYYKNEKSKLFYFNGLDEFMEGASREGHFNGVATIIEKLFRIVNPHLAFFGEKDLQQLQIIKYITKQLDFSIQIIGVPTKREKSGIALSSRNKRLSETDIEKAVLIYQTLQFILKNKSKYTIREIKQICNEKFNSQTILNLEYLEIVGLDNLKPITNFNEKGKNAACIAATISGVRLIDNIIF